MANPYNWEFPQRNQTMFLATIQSSRTAQLQPRQPSFQRNDIPGAQTKQQIPQQVKRENFSHSAFIEPIPNSHVMNNRYIGSNSLNTHDIEGAQPQCSQFKTSRITNPINPRYKLPYVAPLIPQSPRQFIRNTLDIHDIKTKNISHLPKNYEPALIEGSTPLKLFKTVEAVHRLDVKDINRDGVFVSNRTHNPTNPLEPTYTWRDTRELVNQQYGQIGNHTKHGEANRRLNYSMNANDIQGAKSNSYYDRRLFLSKRRSDKDSLNLADLPKSHASSLKKGITTSRHVNPLMPRYQYPN